MNSENDRDEEAALIRSACAGDHRAFAKLVGDYQGRLFRFILQRIGNREDAEDILQITFITAYRGLARYRPAYRFSTWLFTIAHRRTVDRLRRRHVPPEPAHESASVTDHPAELLEQREEEGRLWDLAKRILSDKQHAVLWLRYGEDIEIQEIAAITGLSRSHVKVLLHRARKTLAKQLAPDEQKSEPETSGTEETPSDGVWFRTPMSKTI